jgi:DNA-binding IclR family transcriptional regulator
MGAGLSAEAPPHRNRIRSLVKGLALLETLNEQPEMRFGELCRATGLCYLAFAAEDPIEDIMEATRSDDPQGAAGEISLSLGSLRPRH